MILQSLAAYYQALNAKGSISPPGWSPAKVTFALELAQDGALIGLRSLKVSSADGKKEVAQVMRAPEQVKRAAGINPNYLCDNSSYFLGVDAKGKPARTLECFAAARQRHHALLDGVDSGAARAVLAFFDTWQPAAAAEHPVLAPYWEQLMAGVNLVFYVQNTYAQEDAAIQAAWQASLTDANSAPRRCLVTGEVGPIARLHPSIKGVQGAQGTGASLVSFNLPAFRSYGHEQGDNAPVSEAAAFAYGTALNALLADREHVQHIADTTVVFWAEDAEPAYQDLFSAGLFGSASITQADLKSVLGALAHGRAVNWEGIPLQPDNHFFVLGLAPSAARLSVRFFLQDTFGGFAENLDAHYRRLEIVTPPFEKSPMLSLWRLLNETANQNATSKTPPPPLVQGTLQAILHGADYPAALFENVMLRIRAERDVTWRKAAILKAYLSKNKGITVPEEVLQVRLNDQSDYLPYLLGRLFAMLEKIQRDASPGIKATIRDKYFNSASATPATIFSLLIKLSQAHLKKLDTGLRIHWEGVLAQLYGQIGETYPERLTLQEQGAFHIGYYHQQQKLYEKKNKEESPNV